MPKFNLFKKKPKKDKAGENQNQPKQQDSKEAAEQLAKGMVNVRDIVAPSAMEVDFDYVKIGNTYYRTLFMSIYPRFVGANWLSPIINFEHTLYISMFYYPVQSKGVLDDLRKKITEMEATLLSDREKGKLSDPQVTIALKDAQALQEQLVKGIEKFFQFSFYITIPASSLEELDNITKRLESTLGSLLLISKTATLQMEQAFQSTIPTAMDKLLITRNMDTTSLATTFPFTSSDLTSDEGIMYGINKHNGSLVIFDRFSMENANTVVFATSGAGKSYFVKLEALRSLVFGSQILIIDPEEEYKTLVEAVGGDYISFASNSPSRINPFDLSEIAVEGENELGQKLLSLHTLFKLMLGELSPTEEAILDRALLETYRLKGITADPATQREKEPPVMEDLYKVLLGAEEPEARGMAERLEKYIKGSLAGIFDNQSNIEFGSKITVFSTRNLEDILKPIAYYIILDFVWTRIKKDLKKRILIVEEAWSLLQDEDSARFLYGVAKRARKYYLGLTTISQDVQDFLNSEYGKAIVTNSSIQVLLKQHPAAIDLVADTFYLSEGEKRLLLAADVGEGLFFAGRNHIGIKIKASEAEHNLITTNPEELLKMREKRMAEKANTATQQTQTSSIKPQQKETTSTINQPQNQQQPMQATSNLGTPSPSPQPPTQQTAPPAQKTEIQNNANQQTQKPQEQKSIGQKTTQDTPLSLREVYDKAKQASPKDDQNRYDPSQPSTSEIKPVLDTSVKEETNNAPAPQNNRNTQQNVQGQQSPNKPNQSNQQQNQVTNTPQAQNIQQQGTQGQSQGNSNTFNINTGNNQNTNQQNNTQQPNSQDIKNTDGVFTLKQ